MKKLTLVTLDVESGYRDEADIQNDLLHFCQSFLCSDTLLLTFFPLAVNILPYILPRQFFYQNLMVFYNL